MDPRNMPIERVLTVANPAAGAEISFTPNTSSGWLLRTLRFRLVTSAAVGTRAVTVGASNGANEWFRGSAGNTQIASQTIIYGAYTGSIRAVEMGGVVGVGWPNDGLWIPQGHTLATITENIDVADQFSQIVAYLIEFPTGPDAMLRPFVPTLLEESA